MTEYLPHLTISTGSVLIGGVIFYTWTKVKIAEMKKDLHYYKEFYKSHKEDSESKFQLLFNKVKEITQNHSVIIKDLGIIKYELQINGKKKD